MTSVATSRQIEPDSAALAAELTSQHVADVVEFLNEQPPEIVSGVVAHLPFDIAVEVLDHPQLEASAALIQGLPTEKALTFLAAMSADRAAELFRHLEEPARSHLLARLDPATGISLLQLLAYPPDTAGSLMIAWACRSNNSDQINSGGNVRRLSLICSMAKSCIVTALGQSSRSVAASQPDAGRGITHSERFERARRGGSVSSSMERIDTLSRRSQREAIIKLQPVHVFVLLAGSWTCLRERTAGSAKRCP